MNSTIRLIGNLSIAAVAIIAASALFAPPVTSQVNNPGVTQKGAVVPGHGVSWVGNNQIQDSGAPFPTGDITDVAISSSGSITVTGSPCATGACAFTVNLPAVVTGASVGSATVTPVLTFDNFGRVTNISSATIAPPFSAITGQLACSQHPALTGDVTTVAGNCATTIAAGVIVNSQINASAAIALSKLAAIGANTVLGATSATTPSALAVPSCSGAASALTWTTGSGFGCNTIAAGGTVTSAVCDGVTITVSGTCPPRYGYVNCTLNASASAGALTIALKDNAGSDPSAGSPCNLWFRNATGTTGSWTQRTITSATSLVMASGSTFGVSSSTAFRIWVVAFDNGSTGVLGAINCRSGNDIFALGRTPIASSTAAGAGSTSAQTFYTTSAVTSKPYVILGYLEWNASGVTAGTWTTSNLAFNQSMSADIALPGTVVQTVRSDTGAVATGSTTLPYDDTIPQITEGDQYMSKAITPSAYANMLRVSAILYLSLSTVSGSAYTVALFQDAISNALAAGPSRSLGAASLNPPNAINFMMLSGTVSSTTLRVRAGCHAACTMTFNGEAAARVMGGVANSWLMIEEIQG